ncbi:MAG: efflux RND transporter periplasmic adaptor subunit [Bacteroidota bacterium]
MLKDIINIKIITQNLFMVLALIVTGCKTKNQEKTADIVAKQQFHCPMHADIVRDKPGNCPICGMDLVAFGGVTNEKITPDVHLNTLLKPTNSFVLTTIPVVTIQHSEESLKIEAPGTIQYDTREIGSVSSGFSGRIEKLYLKYTFQDVIKGQKIMDIYSPELLTAQQNLLFLLKNDADNSSFINAAKEKLLLLGIQGDQLQQIIQTKKASLTVPVFSNYSGHIHDALNMDKPMSSSVSDPVVTRDLMIKEGMYVQKGQALLSIYNPHKLWAVLNIYAADQALVKVGNNVHIVAETSPDNDFTARIDFIEPFFREGSKTITARVYFENHAMNMPVGAQIKATITGNTMKINWLPKDAVISMGIYKVVFKKEGNIFKALQIKTGTVYNNKVQITGGLNPADSIAGNAQYLMDSESFIKINQQR